MDARLMALAEAISSCENLADIGADHGKLGAYMLTSGRAKRVQFLDISEASLAKARRLIEKLELLSRAVFSVGDGADAILEPCDAVAIAGMGGETIAGIIERGREKLGSARLILQPNVRQYEARRALMQNGYIITREHIVSMGRRLYCIISAEPGSASYTERELISGVSVEGAVYEFALFKARVTKKALEGAKTDDMLRRELNVWEDIKNAFESKADT